MRCPPCLEQKERKERLDPNIIHAVVSEAPNANALSLSNNTTKENKIAMPCKPHAHNAQFKLTHKRSNLRMWSQPDGRSLQKSTLHRNLGSLTGLPKLSNGTLTTSSSPSSSPSQLFSFSPSPSGGNRIFASTNGARNLELSKSRGDTRSCSTFSDDMSDELSGARSDEDVYARRLDFERGFAGAESSAEPLDTTVERAGREWRMRMNLTSGF
jgi:hypothetical protein